MGVLLLVLAFAMRPQEKEEPLWVLGETGKEMRSSCAFTGLKLSIVVASQVTRDLEIFLQIEFWRLIRGHGCKKPVVTVIWLCLTQSYWKYNL